MSNMTTPFMIAIGLYLLIALIMFGCQRSFLYFPDRSDPNLGAAGVDGLLAVTLESEPGLSLRHWYRPPPDDAAPLVVVFHGNAGHIGHRVPKFRNLLDAGFGLFLAEYRGYGGNPGKPDEPGMTADARAVFSYLAAEGITGDRLVVFGESLGTGPAVKMATEFEVAGVVLESPYISIAEVAQSHYWYLPARWLVLDKWDNASRIDHVGAPLLILHGDQDRVVPARFGRELYELANEPKEALFHPSAGHNGLFSDPRVVSTVISFVKRQMPGSADTQTGGAAPGE